MRVQRVALSRGEVALGAMAIAPLPHRLVQAVARSPVVNDLRLGGKPTPRPDLLIDRAIQEGELDSMKAEMSVMLNVKDVDRSVKFYKSLGFDVRWETKGDDNQLDYAGVGIGDAVIALGRIPKNLRGMAKDYADWVSTPLGAGVMVTVELKEVEKIHELAKKSKVPIDSPLSERLYGTAFMVDDPDGYVIRFLRPKGVYA